MDATEGRKRMRKGFYQKYPTKVCLNDSAWKEDLSRRKDLAIKRE